MAMNNSKKKLILLVIIIVCFFAVLIATSTGAISRLRLSLASGGNVCDGILQEVEADVHISEVPEGEIRYLINKRMVFENKYALGNVMLENPENCAYDIKFVIYKEDGEMIYTSPVIKPGQCLAIDKLSTVTNSGEYNCSYSAKAYLNDKFQGEVTGVVTVIVG